MSDNTRQKIKAIAEEFGYVTNLAARGVRQGWLPLVGVVSDGLITSPFATEIVRGLDGAARSAGMAVVAVSHPQRPVYRLGARRGAAIPAARRCLRRHVPQGCRPAGLG